MAKQSENGITTVNAGETIVHRVGRGWFKAESTDQACTRETNVMAVARQSFEHNAEQGPAYHKIVFAVVKRFFQDPRRSQVVDARTFAQQEALAVEHHDKVYCEAHDTMHNPKETVHAAA